MIIAQSMRICPGVFQIYKKVNLLQLFLFQLNCNMIVPILNIQIYEQYPYSNHPHIQTGTQPPNQSFFPIHNNQINTYIINIMQSAKSTHGLCNQCLNGGLNLLSSKKPNHCTTCQKQADILFNQEPYCAMCYIQTISSPSKSQISSHRGHRKNKSFYTPINKEEVKSIQKSFLSMTGKIIKKISKIFQDNQTQNQLVSFLNKKGQSFANLQWDKFIPKVNKSSNIVYIFIGKTHIIGAFHSQSVNLQGEASVWDQEAGIFKTGKQSYDLQFARVKQDKVFYSSKSKTIKFGFPSSFEIVFDKQIKVSSQLANNFEWTHCFVYRP